MEEAWKEVWQEIGLPSLDEIMKHNAASYKTLTAFVTSIDWTEPLLIGLGVFYLLSFIAIILTRKNFTSQFAIWASFCTLFPILCAVNSHRGFKLTVAMVFLSEPLNDFCMRNWKTLVSRPYFTKSGAFISAVYSAPLLILSLIITVRLVFNALSALLLFNCTPQHTTQPITPTIHCTLYTTLNLLTYPT